jgi:hypothetical protein
MFNNFGPGQIIINNVVINHYILTLEKEGGMIILCYKATLLCNYGMAVNY